MNNGSIAIMQPYIFPYIGYFHLIEASSIFVFYDDVHYIKGGWINRNRMLNQNRGSIFTIPVSKTSPNKLINETSPVIDERWKNKFHKQLVQNYGKAPYFSDVIDQITSVFEKQYTDVTDLAIESILAVYNYLAIEVDYTKSSICSPSTRGLNKADRIIQITKELGYQSYVNAQGGKDIYTKDYFSSNGVTLAFIKSDHIEYEQHSNKFVPCLSIIDVLMFNDKERIVELFTAYSLE